MEKKEDLPQLEASLAEISTLIDQMEHHELTLEQSLQHFERGIQLVRSCQKILEEAEQQVQVLIQNNQQDQLIPYATNKEVDSPSGESSTS